MPTEGKTLYWLHHLGSLGDINRDDLHGGLGVGSRCQDGRNTVGKEGMKGANGKAQDVDSSIRKVEPKRKRGGKARR